MRGHRDSPRKGSHWEMQPPFNEMEKLQEEQDWFWEGERQGQGEDRTVIQM